MAFTGYYRFALVGSARGHLVASTTIQQRRCHHAPQRITREIRAGRRGHRPHVHARIGGDNATARSDTGAEVADRQPYGVSGWVANQPVVDESGSERLNVEDVGAVRSSSGVSEV